MSLPEQLDYVKNHPKTAFKNKLKSAGHKVMKITKEIHKRAVDTLHGAIDTDAIRDHLMNMKDETKSRLSGMLKKFSKIKNKRKRLAGFAFVATKVMLQVSAVVVAAAVVGNMSPMSIFVPGVMASIWEKSGAVFDGTAGSLGAAMGIFSARAKRRKIDDEDLEGNVYLEGLEDAEGDIQKEKNDILNDFPSITDGEKPAEEQPKAEGVKPIEETTPAPLDNQETPQSTSETPLSEPVSEPVAEEVDPTKEKVA